MKRPSLLLSSTALALALCAPPSGAEDSDGWHLSAAVDVLTVGNAGKHNLNAAKRFCTAQIGAGATSCAATATNAGAFGARLGTYRQSGGAYVGASAGYLAGGPTAGKQSFTTVPAGSLTRKTTNSTGRLLLELGGMRPLSETWALGLGVGVGAAVVVEKNVCADSGALAGSCAASGFNSSSKKAWATWELSPSVLYRSVELGVRFVGFGRKKYLPWNAFGLFIGGRF